MTRESELSHLVSIAKDYHLGGSEDDMRIEATVQKYDLRRIDRFIPDGSAVLEMGYGDGITFSHLVRRTEYSLVEAVPGLVEVAKAKAASLRANVTFHEGLFEEFFPDRLYDVVLASHVLEHVVDPVETLRTIRSWLAPTGIVVAIVPNAESIHRRLSVAAGLSNSIFDLSARDRIVGHRRVYCMEELKQHFDQAGFKVTHELGSFLKPLPNTQLLGLSDESIALLCEASDLIEPKSLANLIFVATPNS